MVQRAAKPVLGLRASLSQLPGWLELRILTPSPLPRFIQFIHLGRLGSRGILSRFFRSKAFITQASECMVVTSHCSSLSFIVSAPWSCTAGGLGRSNLFSSFLCGSKLRNKPSHGGGGNSSGAYLLPSPRQQEQKVTEGTVQNRGTYFLGRCQSHTVWGQGPQGNSPSFPS